MACWLRLLACAATIALIYAVEDAHGSEPETTSAGSAPLRGCVATADQLTAAVNSSMGGMFDEVVVNCLAYEDSDRTLDLAILSAFAAGEDDGRYTVQCSNGLLLIQDSPHNASRSVVGCHECSDDQQVPQCASGGGIQGHHVTHTPFIALFSSCAQLVQVIVLVAMATVSVSAWLVRSLCTTIHVLIAVLVTPHPTSRRGTIVPVHTLPTRLPPIAVSLLVALIAGAYSFIVTRMQA